MAPEPAPERDGEQGRATGQGRPAASREPGAGGGVVFFGLEASRPQATRVAESLGVALARHEEREFEDSEFKIRPLESVRGRHAVVYHSLHSGPGASASDKLCRLLFFVGSLRDAGAARVTVLAPYLAFARKDRRTKPRDPLTLRYVAQMFEAVGTDELVTVDVHNVAAFENAFRCVTRNLTAAELLARHVTAMLGDAASKGDAVWGSDAASGAARRLVVLSPDAGGMKRAKAFADRLAALAGRDVGLAFVEKHRSEGRISGDLFAGDVAGAVVIAIDDMICGGSTMARAAFACRERGAAAVHAVATHGLFTHEAVELLAGGLDSVVVTDAAGDPRSRFPEFGDNLVVLDSAALFAGVLGGA